MCVFCYLANVTFIINTEGEVTERHPFKSEAEEGVGDLSKGLTVIARRDENHKFGIKLSVVPIAKLVRRGRLPCLEPGDAKGLRHELC